jgi:glycosyltransferase involved in cell wall biosynthesis
MRITIINWTSRRVGGVETYLNSIIPALLERGHKASFWCETNEPSEREGIALAEGVTSWCAGDLGTADALRALERWRPDLIYAHGLLDPKLEAATLKIAPAIFFAHSYYGTCISGAKAFKSPVVTPCQRQFGLKCLLHYYPHRCGGWSPVTMFREYHRQSERLKLLSGYRAIVTHSQHMQDELVRHGLKTERVHDLLYYVRHQQQGLTGEAQRQTGWLSQSPSLAPGVPDKRASNPASTEWRLLFLGRMDFLKGGETFLAALPRISAALNRPLRVTFSGDGPQRQRWQEQAARVQALDQKLRIDFTGWLKGAQLESRMGDCDLLVLPSLWPEPFGLVGPEAGLRGIPVAAFAVGGIPNWLVDGVNGHLAPGDPPTAEGLAQAVINCLRDAHTHARLGQGAREMAQRFNMENHLSALMGVFEMVLSHDERMIIDSTGGWS